MQTTIVSMLKSVAAVVVVVDTRGWVQWASTQMSEARNLLLLMLMSSKWHMNGMSYQ